MGRLKLPLILMSTGLLASCGGYRHITGQISINDQNQSGQQPIQQQCTTNLKTQLEGSPVALLTSNNDAPNSPADGIKQKLGALQPQSVVYFFDQDTSKKVSKLGLKAIYNKTETVTAVLSADTTAKLMQVSVNYNNNDAQNPTILTQQFTTDQNCNPTLAQSRSFTIKTTDQLNYSISVSKHAAGSTAKDPDPVTTQVKLAAAGSTVILDRLETLDPATLKTLVTTLGPQPSTQHEYILGTPDPTDTSFAREILVTQKPDVSHNDMNGNPITMSAASITYKDPTSASTVTGPTIYFAQDGSFAAIEHTDAAKTETSIVTKDIFDQKFVTEPKPQKTKPKNKIPPKKGNVTNTANSASGGSQADTSTDQEE